MTAMQTRLGTVSYTEEGSGPPVVLLHGALHDRSDFAPITGTLTKVDSVVVRWSRNETE